MVRHLFVVAFIVFGVWCCLSPVAAHEDAKDEHSRFAGKFSGTWGNHVQHGTIEFTVANDGTFKGTLTNGGANATFEGAIGEADEYVGDFQWDYHFGEHTFHGGGPILFDEKGHLIAVMRLYVANHRPLGAIAMDVAPVERVGERAM